MKKQGVRTKLYRACNVLVCVALLVQVSPLVAMSLETAVSAYTSSETPSPASPSPTTQQPAVTHPVLTENATSFTKEGLFGLAVPTTQTPPELDEIPLVPGWNLISTPKELSTTDAAVVLNPLAGEYNVAYAYDGCQTADPWHVFDPDAPSATNDLTTIDHTIGFWVQATTETALALDGTVPPSTTIPLCTGWNLIGLPTRQPRPVRNALFSIDGQYSRVFGYDPTDSQDPWEVYDVTAPEWANDLQVMQPGRGYWILATADVTLTVANEGKPPIAHLISPDEYATEITSITFITDVIGTAYSELLESWTLSYRTDGDPNWIPFATGTTPVLTDTLDQFDPSLLLNDLYRIQLEVRDYENKIALAEALFLVEGQAKVGHFTLPLLDLEVPLLGVPIQVVRTYDSRDKGVGDFGVGWRLSLNEIRLLESGPPGDGWESALGEISENPILPFFEYCLPPTLPHIVAVVLPGNEVHKFRPTVSPECQLLIPHTIVDITYEPMLGTNSTLTPLDQSGQNLLVVGGNPAPPYDFGDGPLGSFDPVPNQFWNQDTLGIHDPDLYQLTLADGTALIIHQDGGLQSITDLNGNVLTVSEDGINHSSGIGITFDRDEQGRITQITDPLSKTLAYNYDEQGDLTHVVVQETFTTTYTYHDDHYLHTIITSNGEEVAAIDYDGDGRLINTCSTQDTCTEWVHDIFNYSEEVTDAAGRTVTYTYDRWGNVISFTNGISLTFLFEYDENHNQIRSVDAAGAVTRYTYDERGNQLSRITPDNEVYSYTYNIHNQLTNLTLPSGAETHFTYDASGNLEEITDGGGDLVLGFTYGPGGIVTSERDRFATITYTNHDALGNPTNMTDEFGRTYTMTYNRVGQLTQVVGDDLDADVAYDSLGRETFIDYGDGLTIDYGYDSNTGTWTTLDGPTLGHRERSFDRDGRLTGWQFSNGATTTYEYDEVGQLQQITDLDGQVTQYTYNPSGRVEMVTLPSTAQFLFDYDPMGRITQTVDPFGNTTSQQYSPSGRLLASTNELGQTWLYTHSLTTTTVIDPLNRETTTIRSPYGLPLQTVNPDGSAVSATYLFTSTAAHAEEYPTSITYENGQTRYFTYDQLGRLETATDLAGNAYTYTYDLYNPVSMIGPTNETVAYAYNADDLLETITYPDGGVESYVYGLSGAPTNIILPSGTVITNTYDEATGQVASISSSLGESYDFFWDANGALSQTTDETGTTAYMYDVSGNLEGIAYPNGFEIHYGRDLLGRVVTVTSQISATSPTYVTQYTYDPAGNITAVRDPLGGLTTYAYDVVSRPLTRTLPNGVVTSYGYNERDQITHIIHEDGAGGVIAAVTYERDGVGEPTKITREDGSYVLLAYDDGLRLIREDYYDPTDTLIESTGYAYDEAGNRLIYTNTLGVSTYSYQSGYQLTAVSGPSGVETYEYDANGRVATRNRDGTTWMVAYDSQDQITAVTDTTDGTVVTYTYDAVGRRVQAADASGTHAFLTAPVLGEGFESPHLAANDQGEVVAGYVYLGQQPLMRFGPEGPVYYLEDSMGSIIGLADASGATVANFHYDGFGNLKTSSGVSQTLPTAVGGDFRFHGAWLEAATNLYYFRARVYDPQVGRFLSRDMAAPDPTVPESIHPYLFAFANPHIYSDPSGFFTITELNTSNAVQRVLQGIRTEAIQYARDQLLEGVGKFAGDVLVDFVKTSIPGAEFGHLGMLYAATGGPDPVDPDRGKAGKYFENLVQRFLCDSVLKFAGPAYDWFYFEVQVDDDGKPLTNGLHCKETDEPFPNVGKLPGIGTPVRPDFVISGKVLVPVVAGHRGRSFLIGDIKIRGDIIDKKPRQFSSILFHASFRSFRKNGKNRGGYGYGLAFFITFKAPSHTARLRQQRKATKFNVHILWAHLWGK